MSGWCTKCRGPVENTLIACPVCNGEEFSFTEPTTSDIFSSLFGGRDDLADNTSQPEAAARTNFFGRSSESKLARESQRELARQNKERQNFLKSPIGMAMTAKEAGNGFFEIELEVGSSDRQVFFGTADFGSHKKKDFTGLLSKIENVGWKLEHVGYYFMITGESSRDKFLASGQSVAVSGKTMGVYLFRSTDA